MTSTSPADLVIPLHLSSTATTSASQSAAPNPLPRLLHTPAGLALLELQGTINAPSLAAAATAAAPTSTNMGTGTGTGRGAVPIGRLHFPDYEGQGGADGEGPWMKRVWMYVGEHQRLLGEVKKLPKAVAVLRRRGDGTAAGGGSGGGGGQEGEEGEGELEVVAVVKYKIVFSSRPEPVGGGMS